MQVKGDNQMTQQEMEELNYELVKLTLEDDPKNEDRIAEIELLLDLEG